MDHQEKFEANRALWNKKTAFHVDSEMYKMEKWLAGETSLDEIVLNEIGDVKGHSLLHLQCHFGQDTMSFSRMGAQATGIDLSDKSIEKATELKNQLGLDTQFKRCNVLDTRAHIETQFDIVYTSYGTICWLPDLDQWAKVVADSMKEGGRFYMAEFHPIIHMFDYPKEDISYPYFNIGAVEEVNAGTYADPNAPIEQREFFWLHSISETVNALLKQGLSLQFFNEHPYSPYDCFGNSKEVQPGKYVFGSFPHPLPHVFSMEWRK